MVIRFLEDVYFYFCSYLKELLAKEGYLIVSVPYNVTFDHERAAKQVYQRFNSCLDTIVLSGVPNADFNPRDLANLPVFSVGHRSRYSLFSFFILMFCFSILLCSELLFDSNGALLQVLTGSYFSDKIPKVGFLVN